MKQNIYQYTITRSRVSESLSTEKVSGPTQVAHLARLLIGDMDREHFATFYMDARHNLIGYEITAIGSLYSVQVHPREVFRGAIMAGAAFITIAHNHPTGDVSPSEEDYQVTEQIGRSGELLGIPLLDHVVVSDAEYYSIKAEAVISEPRVMVIDIDQLRKKYSR